MRRSMVVGVALLLALGAVAGTDGREAAAVPVPGRLGTNLGAVTYYDGLVPFANLVDQAGDWVPNANGVGWGEGPRLRLRRDGWPARLALGQYATTVLAEVRYPAGTYGVSWLGKGSFDINGTTFSSGVGGGTGTVALDGESIVLLNLRSTDPLNPLRAIQVRVPGASPSAVFRAEYLAQLAPYAAVRFMDWTRTNSVAWEPKRVLTCANRTLPTSYSQGTAKGVSVERMVQLANLLDVDPWFTIPHEASSTWARCHARVVASTLEAGLTPRYEFSNETWNPTFRAFHDLTAVAASMGLGGGDSYLGLQIRHGQRHAQTMKWVKAEFDLAGRSFVRVLAGQAANAWVLEQRLLVTAAGAATDEIAIAPYLGIPELNPFDSTDAAVLAGLSLGQIFSQLATAQTTQVDEWTADHVALAATFGKDLVAYEGGQHLAGDTSNDALTAKFTAANRSASMGAAYRTYLANWKSATANALFMHFSDVGPYTEFGSWGALEHPEQGTSPKYDALVDYAAGV